MRLKILSTTGKPVWSARFARKDQPGSTYPTQKRWPQERSPGGTETKCRCVVGSVSVQFGPGVSNSLWLSASYLEVVISR